MQKLIFLFTMLAFAAIARAQDNASFAFDHIALSVRDVDRSADFYKSVLGLTEIINRSKFEGIRWFSTAEGKEVHLISIVREEVSVNKAVHLALRTAGFDAFVTKLEKLGIPYSDWPGNAGKVNIRADGIKQIFFQDPDGYWIEVNSVQPQAQN